jgi:hypothetical protein
VTATVAPKVKTKRNVYRNHERRGGEKSTDKDIAGRKNRTKNTRSANLSTGGVALTAVDPYNGRKEYKEGSRFKRSRSLPASARSITRRSEHGAYSKNDVYATRRNYRSPRTTGFVKAKSVRSNSQPSGKGEKPIFGKKYKSGPTRSVSGYKSARARRSPAPPVSISGSRKRYNQRNTYRGKDRHFGENSSTKDIAGRRLRTRNYRSVKPNGASSGFMPYYGKSAPQGSPKKYGTREARSAKRGGWNNSGQPILGKGRYINSEAAASDRGRMPLKSLPSYGSGREGSYSGNIPAKSLKKYSGGNESTFAGRSKSKKRLIGGGSITRMWNNDGQPIFGSGRGLNGEASSNYKGKMPLSSMPSYSGSREGSYAGKRKAKKPLTGGGGSISRMWNNSGQPILGSGRGAYGEASSNYKGKIPLSSIPSYSGSREGSYPGKMKAKKPLTGGGGSITRHWNNDEQPLPGNGRSGNNEAISGFQGKMKAKSAKKGYHTENFIGGDAAVKQKGMGAAPGTEYGSRKKFLFLYMGQEGGYMRPVKDIDKNENVISQKLKLTKTGQSPGTENGRRRSLSFLRIGNPTQGGLYREVSNKRKNNKLPSDLSGKEKYRLKGAEGFDNGKSTTFSFWAIGNPTRGGLVYSPAQAKGRLHPSSNYTSGNKSRNSIEEKEQPIKLKIWWAKLFKKNSNQPDSVKEKPRRPRYDKNERLIWETAERPNWYDN